MKRVVAGALLLLGTLSLSSLASAEPLRAPTTLRGDLTQHEPPLAETCAWREARVQRWTPALGPPVAFILDVFANPQSNEWIGLGYDANGYWAAEVTVGDGCDVCASLVLSRTGFDGNRAAFPIASRRGPLEGDERRAASSALFRVAARSWNVSKLRHDAALRVPTHDADGQIESFTGWVVEADKKGSFLLRFAILETPFMCWCDAHFRGYTLAAPRR